MQTGEIICNKKYEEILGYRLENFEPVTTETWETLTHPKDLKKAETELEKLFKGEIEQYDVEIRMKHKDGHWVWMNARGRVVSWTKDNEPFKMFGIHLDITERKKLENALRKKNDLLNSVLESIQDGITVLNPDLTIRYTNSTMDKWFESEKIKGEKCFHGFYGKEDICDNCPVQKSLKTGKMESAIKKMPADFDIDFIEIFSYPIIDKEKNKITGVVEFVRDITERLKQKKELEMMNFSINKAEFLIFRVNPDGIIKYVNETVFSKLGYDKNKLIGLKVKNIIKDDQQIDRKRYWEKLKLDKSLNYKLNYITKKGKSFPVEIKSQYFKYEDKEYEFIFAHDITERLKNEKEIKYLAYRDSLTDLYNRKFFEAEMKRLDTESELPISIIMGDLNGLKILNDSYGQKMGDQLLIKTAKMLKEIVRNEDVLARYGGDEFTILLRQTTNQTAQEIVKRIKSKSKKQNIDEVPLSITFGAATKNKKEQEITNIIKLAEDEMYQNKLSESKSGKNKIVQGLLNTLSAKSNETKEHSTRMTELAFKFGKKLGLSNSELNRLSLLATLHDIGKTNIPETILKKPAKLEKKEWEMIKEHPETGYKIASASEEFSIVAQEILHHHEKWDGRGYPDGLKEDEIPYLARIITIIDSYDVMTHDRPYSKAMSKKEALEEIKSCADSQFDSELAEEFVKLVE